MKKSIHVFTTLKFKSVKSKIVAPKMEDRLYNCDQMDTAIFKI